MQERVLGVRKSLPSPRICAQGLGAGPRAGVAQGNTASSTWVPAHGPPGLTALRGRPLLGGTFLLTLVAWHTSDLPPACRPPPKATVQGKQGTLEGGLDEEAGVLPGAQSQPHSGLLAHQPSAKPEV